MAEQKDYPPGQQYAEALAQPVKREANVFDESDERSEETSASKTAMKARADEERKTAQPGRLTSVRDEEGRTGNPLGMPNDPGRGFLGVDPIYQNAASVAGKPFRAEGGPRKEQEDRAFDANEALDAQGLQVGPTGYRR